jgi:hypothetical protein
MFICTNLLFRGPVAVGDSALYYVLCDESCLTADRAAEGEIRNPKIRNPKQIQKDGNFQNGKRCSAGCFGFLAVLGFAETLSG